MHRFIVWGSVMALAACRSGHDHVETEDSVVSCDAADATLHGEVDDPQAFGQQVTASSGAEEVSTTIGDDGVWSMSVMGGRTWEVRLEYDAGDTYDSSSCGCDASTNGVVVEACDATVAVALPDAYCVCADKPNLYLYPPIDTPTSVTIRHGPDQRVFASAPPYGEGWKGTAHPDGTFTPEGGAKAPFLFYEVTVPGRFMKTLQRDTVFCFGSEQILQDLAKLLGTYGFNPREQQDFVDGWASGFPKLPSYAVYPQTRVDAMAPLDVRPNVPIHRLWLLVEPGAGCVPSGGTIAPFERRGAHGVEWGVLYDRRHGMDAR